MYHVFYIFIFMTAWFSSRFIRDGKRMEVIYQHCISSLVIKL